jgi:Protein of unknown function (DUF3168)
MTVLAAFPDAELVFLDLLNGLAPSVTHTDDNLTPPAIQVQRVGGSDNGVTDRPQMQITCYGGTRAQAWALAEQVRQRILAAGATTVTGDFVTGVLVDSTRTVTPAQQIPERNPNLAAVTALYAAGFRRPRT